MTKKALIIVDVQNDFCEGGSLAVEGGERVAAEIAHALNSPDVEYDLIVATYDWHQPEGPEHFAPKGTEPDFNETWPPHCVAMTPGSFPPESLLSALETREVVKVFKGQNTAAFSGFEGVENRDGTGKHLTDILDEHRIDEVHVCGLALDFCVKATTLDALKWAEANSDRQVILLSDLTAAVNPEGAEEVRGALADTGAWIV